MSREEKVPKKKSGRGAAARGARTTKAASAPAGKGKRTTAGRKAPDPGNREVPAELPAHSAAPRIPAAEPAPLPPSGTAKKSRVLLRRVLVATAGVLVALALILGIKYLQGQRGILSTRALTAPSVPLLPLLEAPTGSIASSEREALLEPVETNLGRHVGTGTLAISTVPPGGEVYLDGKRAGVSPLALSNVSAGEHDLQLLLADHQVRHSVVIVKPTGVNELDHTFVPFHADFNFDVGISNAQLSLDEVDLGVSPVRRTNLAGGQHWFTVRSPGYATLYRTVRLDTAKGTPITCAPRNLFETAGVASRPVKLLYQVTFTNSSAPAWLTWGGTLVGNTLCFPREYGRNPHVSWEKGARHTNFYYELVCQVKGSGDSSDIALLFRVLGFYYYYALQLRGDELSLLLCHQNKGDKRLLPFQKCSAINSRGTNYLQVASIDGTIFLFVNGVFFNKIKDTSIESGWIGLRVGPRAEPVISYVALWEI